MHCFDYIIISSIWLHHSAIYIDWNWMDIEAWQWISFIVIVSLGGSSIIRNTAYRIAAHLQSLNNNLIARNRNFELQVFQNSLRCIFCIYIYIWFCWNKCLFNSLENGFIWLNANLHEVYFICVSENVEFARLGLHLIQFLVENRIENRDSYIEYHT